jgi:aspartokinase/homoserine dehydrogenase 1
MLVQKFGGTSLADIDGFNASADVIERHAGDTQLVVVLSAIKGVTDLLTEAIAAAERDESFEQALNEVISLEAAVVTDLGNAGVGSEESRKDVEKHQRRLQSRL